MGGGGVGIRGEMGKIAFFDNLSMNAIITELVRD